MTITIRQMAAPDRAAWAQMRAALWPDESAQEQAHALIVEPASTSPEHALGIGARLIAHVSAFPAAGGFAEMGSDAELENHASHAGHRSWGFRETERVVYFRKDLGEVGR